MNKLKKLLRLIKKLISEALYNYYQMQREYLAIEQWKERKEMKTDLPDKCTDCDSEFVDKAQGSCGYCYLHGYKELGNGGEEIKEYNEDPNDNYDEED